jgi:hypothetical protein
MNVMDVVVRDLRSFAVRRKGIGRAHVFGDQPGVVHDVVPDVFPGGSPVPYAISSSVKKGVGFDGMPRTSRLDVPFVGGDIIHFRDLHVQNGMAHPSNEQTISGAELDRSMDPGTSAPPGDPILVGLAPISIDLGVMLDIFLMDPIHHAPVAIGEKDPSAEGVKVLDRDIGPTVIVHDPFSNGNLHHMGGGASAIGCPKI